MAIVVSIQQTEFESDDVTPELRSVQVGAGFAPWDESINHNFGIFGANDRPMRLPFWSFDDETTIDTAFLPKEHNGTLLMIVDTIDGLSIYAQSNDSAGVWVKKT